MHFVFANPSNDSIATIRISIESNRRQPHYISSLKQLNQLMKITKKSITLKTDVVLVAMDDQLFIPTYSEHDGFWRLRHMPNEFYPLIKNIGITIEESMYFDFMCNNNYRFVPNQHMLMIVEFN